MCFSVVLIEFSVSFATYRVSNIVFPWNIFNCVFNLFLGVIQLDPKLLKILLVEISFKFPVLNIKIFNHNNTVKKKETIDALFYSMVDIFLVQKRL